jgi:hypothetical protein
MLGPPLWRVHLPRAWVGSVRALRCLRRLLRLPTAVLLLLRWLLLLLLGGRLRRWRRRG